MRWSFSKTKRVGAAMADDYAQRRSGANHPGFVLSLVAGGVVLFAPLAGLAAQSTKPKYVAPKPAARTQAPATRPAAIRPAVPSRPNTAGVPNQRPQATPASGNTAARANGARTTQPTLSHPTQPSTAQPGASSRAPHTTGSGMAGERTRSNEAMKPVGGTERGSRENGGKTPATHTAVNEPKETSRETTKETAKEPVATRPTPHIVEKDAKGHVTAIKTASGAEARVNAKTGKVTSFRKVSADGAVTSVHTSPSGVRNVETVRSDSYGHPVRIVSHGGSGYQERDLLRRPGFKQRTYYDHGRSRVVVFRTASYGRYGSFPVYVPDHFYRPAFYAYAATPFGAPVSYAWGANPGYSAFGPYFTPAPSYASPAAFVADFAIGANLNAAARAPQQPGAMGGSFPGPAGDPNGGGDSANQPEQPTGDAAPIPSEVRDAYIQQVEGQIKSAQEQSAGQPGQAPAAVPGALDPGFKVFQSYSDVEADHHGQQCALTGGDFVRREEDAPDASGTVAVTVVTIAKPTASHCEANATVRLTLAILQDWYNSYLETQQQGLAALAAAQGKNGFPPASDVAVVNNPDGLGVPDDAHALAGALQQQQTDASAIQAEVQPGGAQ